MAAQTPEQAQRFADLRSRLDNLNVPNHSHRVVGAFEARRNGDEFVTLDVADLAFLIECAEHQQWPDDWTREYDDTERDHESYQG